MTDSQLMKAVLYFCCFLTGLLICLYVYLILRKVYKNTITRKKNNWVRAMEQPDSPIERFLKKEENSRRVLPDRQWQLEAMESYLFRRLSIVNSKTEINRIYQIANALFESLYRKRLSSSHESIRLNALLLIGHFRIKVLQDDILRFLHKKKINDEELWAALWALAAIQYEGLAGLLIPGDKGAAIQTTSEHHYRQVLLALSNDMLEKWIEHFDVAPGVLQHNLVDVLRIRNLRTDRCLKLFERLLFEDSAELRIRALKAIINFGYLSPETEDRLFQHCQNWQSFQWQERLMLARLMGEIRKAEYLVLLESMVADGSYLVRLEAGQSIYRYPTGLIVLQRIAGSHWDRFAREIAEETLERWSYEHELG